jgi:hypothetical protein
VPPPVCPSSQEAASVAVRKCGKSQNNVAIRGLYNKKNVAKSSCNNEKNVANNSFTNLKNVTEKCIIAGRRS